LTSLNISHRATQLYNLYYFQNTETSFPQRPVISFVCHAEVVFSMKQISYYWILKYYFDEFQAWKC